MAWLQVSRARHVAVRDTSVECPLALASRWSQESIQKLPACQAQRAPGSARRSLVRPSDSTPSGLHYVFLAVGPLRIVGGAFLRGVTGCSLTVRLLSLCIQRLARLAVSTRQFLVRRLDLVHVLATQRLPCALHGTLELGLEVRRQTVRPLLGILFHFVGEAVETVARVDFVAPLLVLAR